MTVELFFSDSEYGWEIFLINACRSKLCHAVTVCLPWLFAHTVEPCITANRLILSPHYFGHFILVWTKGHPLIRPVICGPLVTRLTGFYCTWRVVTEIIIDVSSANQYFRNWVLLQQLTDSLFGQKLEINSFFHGNFWRCSDQHRLLNWILSWGVWVCGIPYENAFKSYPWGSLRSCILRIYVLSLILTIL